MTGFPEIILERAEIHESKTMAKFEKVTQRVDEIKEEVRGLRAAASVGVGLGRVYNPEACI